MPEIKQFSNLTSEPKVIIIDFKVKNMISGATYPLEQKEISVNPYWEITSNVRITNFDTNINRLKGLYYILYVKDIKQDTTFVISSDNQIFDTVIVRENPSGIYQKVIFDISSLGYKQLSELKIHNYGYSIDKDFIVNNISVISSDPSNCIDYTNSLVYYGKYSEYSDPAVINDIYELFHLDLGHFGKGSIDLLTGLLFVNLSDITTKSKNVPISFSACYQPFGAGTLGESWKSNLENSITLSGDTIIMKNNAGFSTYYKSITKLSLYTYDIRIPEEETRNIYFNEQDHSYILYGNNPYGNYEFNLKGNKKIYFSDNKLMRVETPTDEWINYNYNGDLVTITNSDNEEVQIQYQNNRITKVDFKDDCILLNFTYYVINNKYYLDNVVIDEYEKADPTTVTNFCDFKFTYNNLLLTEIKDELLNVGYSFEYNSNSKVKSVSSFYINSSEQKIKDGAISVNYKPLQNYDYVTRVTSKEYSKDYFFNEDGICNIVLNSDDSIESRNYKLINHGEGKQILRSSVPVWEDNGLIKNSSFENPINNTDVRIDNWGRSGNLNNIVKSVSGGIDGGKCLLIESRGSSSSKVSQTIINYPAGNNTLRGFIKYKSLDTNNPIKVNDIKIKVQISDAIDGTIYNTYSKTDFSGNSDWKEFSISNITFPSNPDNRKVNIIIESGSVPSKVWIDVLKFDSEKSVITHNYIRNRYMDKYDQEYLPLDWDYSNISNVNIHPYCEQSGYLDGRFPFIGQNALLLFADNNLIPFSCEVSQSVNISGNGGEELLFMTWCKHYFTINQMCVLKVSVRYYSINETKNYYFSFEPNNHNWQLLMQSIVTEYPYDRVVVTLCVFGHTDAYFTNIQLYKQAFGMNYDYNETNDLVSVRESTNNVSMKYDDKNNINYVKDARGNEYHFEYDSKNRLTKAYDSKNNQLIVEHDDVNNKVKTINRYYNGKESSSETHYDDNENVIKEIDNRGFETNYEYDSKNRLINVVTPNGTMTNFTYNNHHNVLNRTTVLNLDEDSVVYEYENIARIKKLSSYNGTAFDFSYNDNGELSHFLENNCPITNFTYQNIIDNYDSRLITGKIYGSNNAYSFEYEDDRISKVKYNGVTKVSYEYDVTGKLLELTNHENNVTKLFGYDTYNQLTSVIDNNGNHFQYEHDNLKNIQKVIYSNNNLKHAYDFIYPYENQNDASNSIKTGVSYFKSNVYQGMDVISLNGSLISSNGIKPIAISHINADNKEVYNGYFVFDNDVKGYVYGSYPNNKSKLVYDLNLRTTGTISLWVKPESYTSNENRSILTAITKNYYGDNTSELGLFINKDNYLYAERGIGSGFTKYRKLNNGQWYFLSIRWKAYEVSVKINDEPFANYLYHSPDLSDCKIMIGSTVSPDYDIPNSQFNGKFEMISFTDNYLSNDDVNYLYSNGRSMHIIKIRDEYNRPFRDTINTSKSLLETNYFYYEKDNILNQQVTKEILPNNDNIIYSYDEMGNITHKVTLSSWGDVREALSYSYDGLNRLKCEKRFKEGNVFDYYHEYVYDGNGNILVRNSYNSTSELISKLEYTYDNTLKDQLRSISEISFNNGVPTTTSTIQYNYIGPFRLHPSSIVDNGLSYQLTWEGRRLKSYGNNQYTYDENGVRISKVNGDNRTDYVVEGNRIVKAKVKLDNEPNAYDIFYHYDEKGLVVGFNLLGEEYFYLRDITGNINKIIDINGSTMIEYSYNAWGVPTSKILTGSTTANLILRVNQFLYKGYVYDRETNLMLIPLAGGSLYYDPEIGRYINAKDISELAPNSINGLNLYTYVCNNPITVNGYTEVIAKVYGVSAVNAITSSGGFGGIAGGGSLIGSSKVGSFFNQILVKGNFQGKIGYGKGSITGFFHEGTGRFEWKIGKQDGKDKFGIKIGYFEKISLLNLDGRIGFGTADHNIIGLRGVVDIGTGAAFLGIMADPTNNKYFAGVDVGVAVITGRAGVTIGNFAEVGVYGEALGAGFKLGLIFEDGELEFTGGGTFIIGGGFYIRIKF